VSFEAPQKYRIPFIVKGVNVSTLAHGNNGMFRLPAGFRRSGLILRYPLRIISSDGTGWLEHGLPLPAWEHVSVSTAVRCPTWEEMCLVKALFWGPEDLVIQIHPPGSSYVNDHEYCLHLWRPIGFELPAPPAVTVGYGQKVTP
jgi:hypothetical protein